LGYLSSDTTNVEPIVNAPVKLLLSLGSAAESDVVKELKRRDPIVRARALHVLARLPQPNVRRARLVIAMLSDDSEMVRKEVRESLPFLGKEAAPEVRKLLTSKISATRFNSAYALSLIQPDQSLLPLLKEGLKDSTCAVKVDLIPRLSGFDSGADVEALLLKCIEASAAGAPFAANALIAMSPLTNSILDSLFDSIKQKRLPKPAAAAFVRELPKIAGTWEAALPYFGNVLRDFDDELKLLVLERVRTSEGARAPLLETIRNLTGDAIHPALRWQALVIMSLESQPDASELIYRQLERDEFEWASGAIRHLPQAAGKDVIAKALTELNGERLALVIREVGFAGDKFKDYLPPIIAMIDSDDPLVSYQAGLTLIRLQPEHPKAPLALKRDLLGPYRTKLFDEDLPTVQQVAEKILQTSESYAERQVLNSLLTMRSAEEQRSPLPQ
jgi:HEAT repeat protein